jgi:threonine synthase
MDYISTRDAGRQALNLDAALNAGLAPDGGLYVPTSLPRLSIGKAGASLAQTCASALTPFFSGSVLASQLDEICAVALNLPMPRVALSTSNAGLLELFHGPTAAFKDFAARFLSECLQRLRAIAVIDAEQTVLVATSGDTGGAVAAAFHNKPGFRVVILYPDGRVSARQAHQLSAFGGNVHTYKIQGSFDDCQALVKQAFSDATLRAACPLISANSISLGRLLPQMAYFVDASLRNSAETNQETNIIIPSGNLGHGLGAVLARAIGAPIGHIVLASNANHVLSDYLAGNSYQAHASISTLANAMDVGAPSNFERLQYLFPKLDNVTGGSVDDAAISDCVRRAPSQYGQIICPHTACGVVMLERQRSAGDQRHYLIAATAHAAKFDSVVEPLIGQTIKVPSALAELLARPAQANSLDATLDALKSVLLR